MWVIVGLNRWAMALPGSRKRPTDNGELLREERFYDSESHTRTFVKDRGPRDALVAWTGLL